MIAEIHAEHADPIIKQLLSYATSSDKVSQVYNEYMCEENQHLLGLFEQGEMVGCIGIEVNNDHCEIKHIAVLPRARTRGIGSQMIQWVYQNHSIQKLMAETDRDAVGFYLSFGFKITLLGEKYPGVERFLCEYER